MGCRERYSFARLSNAKVITACISHRLTAGPLVKHLHPIRFYLADSILYGLSMEGTQSKPQSRKAASLTQGELIVEVWDRLGRPAIGERELTNIQRSVRDHFGRGDEESPAAIARVLADEGAELLHPEVIEFDARWREAKIENDSRRFKGLENFLAGKPLRLKQAEALIKKLERRRKSAEKSSDQIASNEARNVAIAGRHIAELLAQDRKLNQLQRTEQAEIAEWLKVWIQTPGLFADWLDLRRRSPEFRKKFSATDVAP